MATEEEINDDAELRKSIDWTKGITIAVDENAREPRSKFYEKMLDSEFPMHIVYAFGGKYKQSNVCEDLMMIISASLFFGTEIN
jgi:hypothetical protein